MKSNEKEKDSYSTKNRRTKGKRRSTPKSHNNRDFRDEGKTSTSNDVSWYSKNPGLLANAANISYGNALGSPVSLNTTSNESYNIRFPGIVVYDVVPGPGVASAGTDAVNVAADNIYAHIRQSNSGGKNYDPNDLMSYLLAVDEAYMLFWDAVRIYGAINLYNNVNRYAPKALVNALGWDYDNLVANLPQFIYYLNQFGVKMNSLAVPTKWPYYQRHAWMYSGIYADGTSAKAQLYAYRPVVYRVLDDATGHLNSHNLWDNSRTNVLDSSSVYGYGSTLRTLETFTTACDEVFEALINSEFSGIMSGDIRKAFGDQLVTLPFIPTPFKITVTYNEEVLSQFQNAQWGAGLADYDIKMDNALNTANVVYTPKEVVFINDAQSHSLPSGQSLDVINAYLPSANKHIINLNLNDPKPGDTVVASRLLYSTEYMGYYLPSGSGSVLSFEFIEDPEYVTTSGSILYKGIRTCGSEIVTGVHITTIGVDGVARPSYVYNYIREAGSVTTLGTAFRSISYLSKFKFAPLVWQLMDVALTGAKHFPWGEIDNYAVVDAVVLKNMNDVAVLSLFDVPIQ